MRRFAFRLAKELGIVDVDAMLRSISARTFWEWVEYYRIEPFGEERGELMLAQLTALVANALRRKGQRAWKVSDFMPRFDGSTQPRRRRQTWQEMKAMAAMLTAEYNAKERKRRAIGAAAT